MKFLIDEKGNKYIPESDMIAIETIKEVLQSNKYITDFVVDDIIATFQSLKKSAKVEIEKSEKPQVRKSKILSRNNILDIDSEGYLIYKRGKSKQSKWNLNQVIAIQTKLGGDYSHVSSEQKDEMKMVLGLNDTSIKTILTNLKDGELEDIVEEWKVRNNYGIKKKPTPLENNPERRKEMGFGGIP